MIQLECIIAPSIFAHIYVQRSIDEEPDQAVFQPQLHISTKTSEWRVSCTIIGADDSTEP